MTILSRIRYAISLPIIGLMWLTYAVGWLFRVISMGFYILNTGARDHVWWVLIAASRIVQGKPVWAYEDLQRGRQPATARARALAEADPRVEKIVCPCGSKTCVSPVLYVPKGFYEQIPRPSLDGMMSIPAATIMKPGPELEAAANRFAEMIRAQLETTNPTAAPLIDRDDINNVELLALNNDTVPSAAVLALIQSLRGNPIVIVNDGPPPVVTAIGND